MEIAIIVCSGILLGGLVNALADNLPHGRLLSTPRYGNDSVRPLVAWLGISAFLFNRRRPDQEGSGDSENPLSWRYPLTELVLTTLLLATHFVAGATLHAPLGQQLLWQIYTVVFVLLAVVDIEHKQILVLPVIAASLLALFDAALFPQHPPYLGSSLAGGVVGGSVFSLVYIGGQIFGRSRRGLPTPFGKGDIYLMALGGLVVGLPDVLVTMTGAVFLGGFGALAYILGVRLLGRSYQPFAALPYGPNILAATYFVMLFPGAISL